MDQLGHEKPELKIPVPDCTEEAWNVLQAAGKLQAESSHYIRPICLIQVERTGKEQREVGFIHAEDARDLSVDPGREGTTDCHQDLCYPDGGRALHWWHRNVARWQYALQGWRKNKIYLDFIFAMSREGAGTKGRIMILETKGDHLDNPDTRYKQEVLKACADAFRFENVTGRGEWRYPIRAGS